MDNYFNERRFLNLLDAHKRIIGVLGREIEDKNIKNGEKHDRLFTPAVRTGRELALILYIKRHGTNSLDNLQFHHLIRRTDKGLLPFCQYAPQRNYFANIAVIKQKDHKHNNSEELVITNEFIQQIIDEYFTDNFRSNVLAEVEVQLTNIHRARFTDEQVKFIKSKLEELK